MCLPDLAKVVPEVAVCLPDLAKVVPEWAVDADTGIKMLRGPAGIVILAWPFARLGFSFLAMGCDNGSTGRLALDMKGCQGWTFLVLGFGGVAIEFNVVGGTDVRWGCGRGKIALTAGVRGDMRRSGG